VGALTHAAKRALRWLPPSPATKALAGAGRPGKGVLAQLQRRGLAVPVDPGGNGLAADPGRRRGGRPRMSGGHITDAVDGP
jgi:hypothetical protein